MNNELPGFWLVFAPLALILVVVSLLIGIITITLTVLYNKTSSLDKQEKLEYISGIWVGSRAGFLKTLFWLWCPLMTAFILYKPVSLLLPFSDDMAAAVNSLVRAARKY